MCEVVNRPTPPPSASVESRGAERPIDCRCAAEGPQCHCRTTLDIPNQSRNTHRSTPNWPIVLHKVQKLRGGPACPTLCKYIQTSANSAWKYEYTQSVKKGGSQAPLHPLCRSYHLRYTDSLFVACRSFVEFFWFFTRSGEGSSSGTSSRRAGRPHTSR